MHNRVINTVWNWVAAIYARRAGCKLIAAWYDSDNNELRARLLVGFGSPIAGAVVAFIIFVMMLVGTLVYMYIKYLKTSKEAEIQDSITKREAIKKEILDEIKKQYEEGNISKETYEQAVTNISEAFDEQAANTPVMPVDISTILAMVSLFLAVVIIVSLVKMFKK